MLGGCCKFVRLHAIAEALPRLRGLKAERPRFPALKYSHIVEALPRLRGLKDTVANTFYMCG